MRMVLPGAGAGPRRPRRLLRPCLDKAPLAVELPMTHHPGLFFPQRNDDLLVARARFS